MSLELSAAIRQRIAELFQNKVCCKCGRIAERIVVGMKSDRYLCQNCYEPARPYEFPRAKEPNRGR